QDDRLFATMSNAEGQSYVPVFTNLTSFAKWYGNETFGLPFRKAKGTILQWPLSEIYQPSTGENELDKVQGIVINPFDDQPELIDWAYFENDSK
ncbi:SseB family protein, partial [Streptococcus vestibularis]